MTSTLDSEPLRDPWERLMVGPATVIDDAPSNLVALEALFGPNPLKTRDWFLVSDGKHTLTLIDLLHPRFSDAYAESTGQSRKNVFLNALLPASSAARYGERATDLPSLVLDVANGIPDDIDPDYANTDEADGWRAGSALLALFAILPADDQGPVRSIIALTKPTLARWLPRQTSR